MTARVGTSVFLVVLAAAVLMASGCGTTVRSAVTGVSGSAAAASRAAPGSHPAAATQAARATPSPTGSPLAPTGSVTGCRGPIGSYPVTAWPHGGTLLWCSRSRVPLGRLSGVRPSG